MVTYFENTAIAVVKQVEKFFAECSPERENLCLYGYADGTWEVALPCEEVSTCGLYNWTTNNLCAYLRTAHV